MLQENVSILILNYNSFDLVKTFFSHNYFHDPHAKWIIVDNGSSGNIQRDLITFACDNGWNIQKTKDEKFENFREAVNTSDLTPSDVYLLLLEKNYGYALGNNIGLEFISTHFSTDYVVIANTDILWEHDVIEHLLDRFQQDTNLAVVAPRIIGPTGDEQNPQFLPETVKIMQSWYRLFFPFSSIFYRIFSLRYDYKRSLEKNQIHSGLFYFDPAKYCFMGSCFVINFVIFKSIGFFDSRTFLGTEEPRLVHRLKDRGYGMAIDLDVSVIHDQGSTARISFPSARIMEYFEESDYTYLRDYCGYNSIKLLFIRGTAWYYRKFWLRLINYF